MLRYRLVQLTKDLKANEFTIDQLQKPIEIVYTNLAENRDVENQETVTALRKIYQVAENLTPTKEEWKGCSDRDTFDSVVSLFEGAQGFDVKKSLKHFSDNAFFVMPYWTDEESNRYQLREELLVCMLLASSDSEPLLEGVPCVISQDALEKLMMYHEMSTSGTSTR